MGKMGNVFHNIMTTTPDAINIAKKAYIPVQYMASRSEPDSTDLTSESFSLWETYIHTLKHTK